MQQLTSNEWIEQALSAEPLRSKSLVMTVMGDAIAPHGGAVWLGSLIELLAPLGVTDRLVRTSVFRLVQEGWLNASREGRRSRYAFEPRSLPRFQRADRRIYAPPGLHWDGRWTLVLAPNGSIDGDLRTAVRKELEWAGFAMLGPGMLAHPAADAEGLLDALDRTGGRDKVFVLSAAELPDVGSRPLGELVGEGWDLTAVARSYVDFIARFTPLLELLRTAPALAPADAFAVRSLLIHAYRRLQLHDPMLPIELLPDPWPGSDAYAVARAIYLLVYAQAEVHIDAVLRREDEAAPSADEAFYQRFGGLRG
ncbi:phenylacetic acid degradation operon negative regulatory protein PaaX [Massilia sp. Mn16-1_5]|uniref:phenylacetic acid degradation operon negative regulatory protein PaaX n=1 Tax=Massilia sp. Mn16-1_5 TaxID=2079199 RepID=UPI00109EDD0D|nr:phenylacetic acid degradation operon negative regulatory protein PaaX [Massilia sp. Mn16-1_5]THC42808.1 phenylacetic acid degradation operon negative regulatory protein PaaX [Massilia sp. Mn16-1_5]